MAELIEVPFETWTRMGLLYHIGCGPDPSIRWGTFGGTCPAVDLFKVFFTGAVQPYAAVTIATYTNFVTTVH